MHFKTIKKYSEFAKVFAEKQNERWELINQMKII